MHDEVLSTGSDVSAVGATKNASPGKTSVATMPCSYSAIDGMVRSVTLAWSRVHVVKSTA